MQNQQVAAEPYETIAFAIPSKELVTEEEDPDSIWESWDPDSKVSKYFIVWSAGWLKYQFGLNDQVFSCQFLFR
jgi:hypothetical protein